MNNSKLMKTVVFASLSLTVSGRAEAAVNMWSGGYQKTWTDLEFSGHGTLALKRSYNSRSMATGLFGFGWCLEDLEVKLQPLADDGWRLLTCNGPQDFVRQGPGEWVHEASGSILMRKGISLERKTEDGGAQTFTPEGSLQAVRRPSGESWLLNRDALGRLEHIRSSLGPSIKLVYDPQTLRVVRVEAGSPVGPFQTKRNYRYRNGNLTEAADEAASLFLYSYDVFHNLTRTDYPDSTFEALSYDDTRDRIHRIRTRDACVETYQFQTPEKDHLVSSAEKSCSGAKISSARHEYWHRTDGQGRVYLSQARVTQGKKVFNAQFEPRGKRMTASELSPRIERRH